MTFRVRLWFALAVSRFVWALLPQTGYIHPDEFFQSVEIVAGDLFRLNVTRTWEFDNEFPVRSVVPMYVVVGLPLLLLRFVSQTLGMPLVSWYSVTVSVRGTLALLSYVVDFCAYRLSRQFDQKPDDVLLAVSSSFVALVFYSRPFSNTIESFLFALLLLVTESRVRTASDPSRSTEPTQQPPNAAAHSKSTIVVQSDVSDTVLISFLVVMGVFNRPTFVVYAAMPCLFWLFRGTHWNVLVTQNAALVASRCFYLVTFASVFITTFAVFDSIYFGRLPFDVNCFVTEISVSQIASVIFNLTITPLNFVFYNIRADNLALHGVHPRVTHFLVNIPLLFGIMGLFFILDALCTLCRQTRAELNVFLMLTVSTPLLLLSVFPHQEPRFLIPLLLPICLLYSSKLFCRESRRSYLLLWAIGNLFCGLFFGVLHQGGVLRALGTMQQERLSSAENTVVIFWRTYMPPKHLLLSPARTDENVTRGSCPGKFFELHDFAGSPFDDVRHFAKLVHSSYVPCESQPIRIILVAPGSLNDELACKSCRIRLELISSYWPHLSTEDLPLVGDPLCLRTSGAETCKTFDPVERLVLATSLNVYRFVFEA